jgi:hypothetical protein
LFGAALLTSPATPEISLEAIATARGKIPNKLNQSTRSSMVHLHLPVRYPFAADEAADSFLPCVGPWSVTTRHQAESLNDPTQPLERVYLVLYTDANVMVRGGEAGDVRRTCETVLGSCRRERTPAGRATGAESLMEVAEQGNHRSILSSIESIARL